MTPEDMAACHAGGRFWWMRPDGTFYGLPGPERVPETLGDFYLLDASPEWVAQWPDWDAAAAEMAPLFERLDEYRD